MTISPEPAKPDLDALQNGAVRDGGAAAGGIAPQPQDPTNPDMADVHAADRDAAQAARGFGDDRARSTL